MKPILIYTTTASKQEAQKISHHLLNKKLIACANFFPIESIYSWQGKITEDKEYTLLLKTEEKHLSTIKKEIKTLHSYHIPCIIKINIDAEKDYGNWLLSNLKP